MNTRISPPSPAAGVLSPLALTLLITLLGFQLLRIFIPTLLFYVGEVVGLTAVALGLVGTAVFLSGLLAVPFQRLLGLRPAIALTAGGTALLRLAEQISVSPPLDLALSVGGVALFLSFIPLVLAGLRTLRPARPLRFPLALLLGVAADTGLHIAAGTYDLTWQAGLGPVLLVLALALLTFLALVPALRALSRQPAAIPWRRAWPLIAFGPWLALQLIVFQNVARTAALTGWSLPAAAFVVTASNILGLLGAAWLAPTWGRGAALLAGLALLLLFLPTGAAGLVAALLVVGGQFLAATLLARAFAAALAGHSLAPGLARTTLAYGLGLLLLALLFFAYHAPHSLALPFTEVMVLPFMALFFAIPATIPAAPAVRSAQQPGRPGTATAGTLLLATGVLLLAPASLAFRWQPPALQPPPAPLETIRVLDYNLHNGFDVTGRLDMEALAQVILESEADVVTLQEVSRGWVVAGSLDMLSWLAHRLDMTVASGPTMSDRQWGNAILSRYPLLESRSVSLPSAGLPLQRGYLRADLDTGGPPLTVISTHLHHVVAEGPVREEQVAVLLRDWNGAPRTILAGDLNAEPDSREMALLADAGLIDVVVALDVGPAYTSPAAAPVKRIDYIWLSPDLRPQSFRLFPTTASDHLPLLAVVHLPAD